MQVAARVNCMDARSHRSRASALARSPSLSRDAIGSRFEKARRTLAGASSGNLKRQTGPVQPQCSSASHAIISPSPEGSMSVAMATSSASESSSARLLSTSPASLSGTFAHANSDRSNGSAESPHLR